MTIATGRSSVLRDRRDDDRDHRDRALHQVRMLMPGGKPSRLACATAHTVRQPAIQAHEPVHDGARREQGERAEAQPQAPSATNERDRSRRENQHQHAGRHARPVPQPRVTGADTPEIAHVLPADINPGLQLLYRDPAGREHARGENAAHRRKTGGNADSLLLRRHPAHLPHADGA